MKEKTKVVTGNVSIVTCGGIPERAHNFFVVTIQPRGFEEVRLVCSYCGEIRKIE